MASMVVGGIQFESMLCHCKIWCKAIPSTKPPKPTPSSIPAVVAFLGGAGVCIRMSYTVLSLPLRLLSLLPQEGRDGRQALDMVREDFEGRQGGCCRDVDVFPI